MYWQVCCKDWIISLRVPGSQLLDAASRCMLVLCSKLRHSAMEGVKSSRCQHRSIGSILRSDWRSPSPIYVPAKVKRCCVCRTAKCDPASQVRPVAGSGAVWLSSRASGSCAARDPGEPRDAGVPRKPGFGLMGWAMRRAFRDATNARSARFLCQTAPLPSRV